MVQSSPALANGRILVGSNDGKLYAYGNAAALVNGSGSSLSSITATPSVLSPAFSPTTNDYVVQCQAGSNLVNLQLAAASGTITVGTTTGATVTSTVLVVENQAIIVTAPSPGNPASRTQY